MNFLFRPMVAPAVYLKKYCQQLAVAMLADGVVTRIRDGYIVRVTRLNGNYIADVIETPAYFVGSRRDYNLTGDRPAWGFVFGDRGVLYPRTTPGGAPLPPPVTQAVDNTYLFEVPGLTYVGVPPEPALSTLDFFPPMCRAGVVKDRAHFGYLGLADDGAAYSGLQAYDDIVVLSFRTTPTIYADYPSGVATDTQPPINRLVFTDRGLQAVLGNPETFLSPDAANLIGGTPIPPHRPPACTGLITPPLTPEGDPKYGVVLAQSITYVDARDVLNRGTQVRFGLLVTLANIAVPDEAGTAHQEGTPVWHELRYTEKRYLSSLGIASDGDVATVVAASTTYEPGINGYTVEASWYDSAGLVGSSVIHSVATAGLITEAWQAIGEVVGGVALAIIEGDGSAMMTGVARFAICRQGTLLQSDMHDLGWRPHTSVCRGQVTPASDSPNVTNPIRFSATADLGDGQVCVVACPSSDLTNQVSGTAAWSLVVLDAESLEFIEARGEIASLFFQAGITDYAYQTVSVTVVAQQSRDDAGAVTQPAVLLATVAETIDDRWLLLSRDGGYTWDTIREGQPAGDTFYIGNRLHLVELGKQL